MQVIDFEQLGLVIVESRLDFIAPKMGTIAMDSLLTAGGKEHRSGARRVLERLPELTAQLAR